MDAPSEPINVLTGPTASGKSDLALEWARRAGGEIVTADSMQVYRGLDIGTAKPDALARQQVPHHLLDIVDVEEGFSAARFQDAADRAIADIAARQRPVFVVGGTMLYVRALLRGLHPAPPADAALRTELARLSIEEIAARLEELDPASARRIHAKDRVRLTRALEITIQSGTPASLLRAGHGFRERRYRFRLFALVPPADKLTERIAARVDRMVDAGLIEETRWLLDRASGAPGCSAIEGRVWRGPCHGSQGAEEEAYSTYADDERSSEPTERQAQTRRRVQSGTPLSLPALRALGYRQMAAYLRGEVSRSQAIERCKRDTRSFARRQLAWLRGEPEVRYLERPQPMEDAA